MSEKSHVTSIVVQASRVDNWWNVQFTLEGREMGTQARRFNQIEEMVVDAATLMTGRVASDFSVNIVVDAPNIVDLVADYKLAAATAAQAEKVASATSRRVVNELRNRDLSVVEIAQLMGLSKQRVSQLMAV